MQGNEDMGKQHGTQMPKCDRLRMGGNLLPFSVSARTPRNCPICVAPSTEAKLGISHYIIW